MVYSNIHCLLLALLKGNWILCREVESHGLMASGLKLLERYGETSCLCGQDTFEKVKTYHALSTVRRERVTKGR